MKNNKLLIGLLAFSVVGLGFSYWIYKKKKEDSSWKLLKLPNGNVKRSKKVVVTN